MPVKQSISFRLTIVLLSIAILFVFLPMYTTAQLETTRMIVILEEVKRIRLLLILFCQMTMLNQNHCLIPFQKSQEIKPYRISKKWKWTRNHCLQ